MTEIRPRVGKITRRDGRVVPVSFTPAADDPTTFEPFYAGRAGYAGEPAQLYDGDVVWVDVIGPGQSVRWTRVEIWNEAP